MWKALVPKVLGARALSRRISPNAVPLYEGDLLPLLGHRRALRDNPQALLRLAEERLGPVFRLDLGRRSLVVVTGEPAEELGRRGEFSRASTRGAVLCPSRPWDGGSSGLVLHWEAEAPWSACRRGDLAGLVTPALLRAPVERFARVFGDLLASWPEEGTIDAPRLASSLLRALAVAFVGVGRVDDVEAIFSSLEHALGAATPSSLEVFSGVMGHDRASSRAFRGAQRRLEALLVERRRKPREAAGLLEAWRVILGSRDAARLGVRTGLAARRILRLSSGWPTRVLLRDLSRLDDLLQEQDLLHGDHGGPTYETLEKATELGQWIDVALEPSVSSATFHGSPRMWRMISLERDLRVGRWLARRGDQLLIPSTITHPSGTHPSGER
ncbi:MAG: hypothetical protein KAI47_03385, partial [Deltaproteobacteria bacterium]|nr:hypothetical protein [Deltaproteobacteria bacterium]